MKKYPKYNFCVYIKKDNDLFLSDEFKKIRKEINTKTRTYFHKLVRLEINRFKKNE